MTWVVRDTCQTYAGTTYEYLSKGGIWRSLAEGDKATFEHKSDAIGEMALKAVSFPVEYGGGRLVVEELIEQTEAEFFGEPLPEPDTLPSARLPEPIEPEPRNTRTTFDASEVKITFAGHEIKSSDFVDGCIFSIPPRVAIITRARSWAVGDQDIIKYEGDDRIWIDMASYSKPQVRALIQALEEALVAP